MRTSFTVLIIFLISGTLWTQEIHTQSNAASLTNESDATLGWTGGAVIATDNTDVHDGLFSLSITSSGLSSGRNAEYTFSVTSGAVYTITIWAKRATQSYLPAFANWSGFSNFSEMSISTTNWTAYNFQLTANANTAVIRIYTSPVYRGSTAGDGVLIDAVHIAPFNEDSQPPTAISDLAAASTTATGTTLSWSPATDNVAVVDYEVFQDGVSIGLSGGSTSFNVANLSPETAYTFTAVAIDGAGNTSLQSNTVNITTLNTTDSQPPTAISDLAAASTTATGTTLSWSPATDNVAVVDYEVFQDGVSIGLSGGSTSFNVTNLTPETAYTFTAAAIDAAGNTSAQSNTVNITTLEAPAGGITDYTSENSNLTTVDWQANNLLAQGSVGIGTSVNPSYRLAVAGNIVAEEVRVALQANWPDYVFESDYTLPTLTEVEQHIKSKKHLIDIPSALEVERQGIALGDMNAKLLRKIEELTLYLIKQEKQIQKLRQLNDHIYELMDRVRALELKLTDN